jgi:hypothetical protein
MTVNMSDHNNPQNADHERMLTLTNPLILDEPESAGESRALA